MHFLFPIFLAHFFSTNWLMSNSWLFPQQQIIVIDSTAWQARRFRGMWISSPRSNTKPHRSHREHPIICHKSTGFSCSSLYSVASNCRRYIQSMALWWTIEMRLDGNIINSLHRTLIENCAILRDKSRIISTTSDSHRILIPILGV